MAHRTEFLTVPRTAAPTIELMEADLAIICDFTFNPTHESKSAGRIAFRTGQLFPVSTRNFTGIPSDLCMCAVLPDELSDLDPIHQAAAGAVQRYDEPERVVGVLVPVIFKTLGIPALNRTCDDDLRCRVAAFHGNLDGCSRRRTHRDRRGQQPCNDTLHHFPAFPKSLIVLSPMPRKSSTNQYRGRNLSLIGIDVLDFVGGGLVSRLLRLARQVNGPKLIEPLIVNGIQAARVATTVIAILEPTALHFEKALANGFFHIAPDPHVDGVHGAVFSTRVPAAGTMTTR
ncbi:hypothetical protein ACVMB2_007019 [Sinorhizobium meliloti]